jgi:hypothetical protein
MVRVPEEAMSAGEGGVQPLVGELVEVEGTFALSVVVTEDDTVSRIAERVEAGMARLQVEGQPSVQPIYAAVLRVGGFKVSK